MGRESFFVTFRTTRPAEVDSLWQAFCAREHARQRDRALREIAKEGVRGDPADPEVIRQAVAEHEIYNASPLSFDTYRYRWVAPPSGVRSVGALREWMLAHHEKWEAALAVPWRGRTVVGGWVAH